jgi:hypothetical protein
LEDERSKQTNEIIKNIIKLAENKIKSYYPTTDGNVYIVATGKFNLQIYKYIIFLLFYII